MNYKVDAHTHTIISGHAFNTIIEMATAAKKNGLELLCITDHAPAMPGTCHEFYFHNYRIVDRNAYAIPLMMGVELNILDKEGSVDMSEEVLSQMDIAVASLHPPCIAFMNQKDNTQALVNAMKNPYIHIIGHPDDGRYPIDYNFLAKTAKETNTLLEVNNSSLLPTTYRPNAKENYKEMLCACIKYDTSIILNSDAHIDTSVGRHDLSEALLKEVNFPEELVVNTSVKKFKDFIKK